MPHVETVEVEGQEYLLAEQAATPSPTLERIVDWLSDPNGSLGRVDVPRVQATAVLRTEGGAGVLERPVDLGPAHLFGILTEPEHHADPAAPTVVFLNVGRIAHHGPGRLWVELARSWAANGLRCLRADIGGIGDSPTRPGRTELVVFPEDALEDLEDIRRAAVDGDAEVVLVGLCSGAAHAIESALAQPVGGLCVINPVLTYARWGEHSYRYFEPNQESSHGSGDRQSWRATRPWVSRAMMRLARLQGATRRIPNAGWWVVNRWFLRSSPARTMERLTESGVDVLVVLGDEEARGLYRGDHRRIRSLIRDGGLTVETVPGLDHSLFVRTSRERVSGLLSTYVLGRYADVERPSQLDEVL